MKLRVIAGWLGSRQFASPATHTTHPMSERMRGALFNALGTITNKTVLDAFAGSGALSFESISRGATSAVAIERDRRAQQTILKNIQTLGLTDQVVLARGSCRRWSELHPEEQFDLILCDPPYDELQLSTLSLLSRHLKNNGLMVVSYPGRESAPTVNGVVVVDKSYFGDAALAYYRKAA